MGWIEDLAGLVTGTTAANKASEALTGIKSDITQGTDLLQGDLRSAATFQPFTVTTGQGTVRAGTGGVQFAPTAAETGLASQAQSMISGLGNVPNVSGLQGQAFTGASNLLGQNTGQFASQLGGLYAGMGENQIKAAAAPSNLAALQQQFATQAGTGTAGSLGGLTGQLQSLAGQQLGAATPTAQSVYQQIRAMQSPEEQRQQLELENRLAAQGRLGVQTSMYGGTPEQLALAKAQAEAQNAAALQAISAADQLATSQQARAAQLAQLGMSAEQIDSQLATEGLGRQATAGQLAGSLAQTGAGISTQQQQLGQGLLGLGLKAQQLGGTLGAQDIASAAQLYGLGSQATALPYQTQAMQLGNITQALTAAGIPMSQQIAALSPALQLSGQNVSQQLGLLNALAQTGQTEMAGLGDIGQALAAVQQERIKAGGQALSGLIGGIADILG